MTFDNRINSWKSHFLFFVLYFLSIRLGLLFTADNQIAIIWPATGLGISLIMVYGTKHLPSIALAALVGNIVTGGSPIVILGVTIANIAEAVIGSWAINKIRSRQNNSHSMTIAVILGTFIASTICATTGVLSLYWAKVVTGEMYLPNWIIWFTGNYLAGLLTIPLFVSMLQKKASSEKSPLFSTFLISLMGAGILWFVFFRAEGSVFLFIPLFYILVCIAFLQDKASKIIIILFSIGIVVSTKAGSGFFHLEETNSNLAHLEIILFAIAISSLFIFDFKKVGSFKIPGIVLCCGFFASSIFFYTYYIIDYEKKLENFRENIASAVKAIEGQIKTSETAMRSGAGLMAASKSVEKSEWKEFVNQLDLQTTPSGMLGLGVVFRVKQAELDDFVKKNRNDGAWDFKIHNVPDGNYLGQEYSIITYAEPLHLNQQAVGLNIASESKRKIAADLSTDTGKLAISDTITLVQDENSQVSFLIFYPIYSHGTGPKTIEERRARSIGWIYSPIKVKEFFDAALGGNHLKNLSYLIMKPGTDKILANSKDFFNLLSIHGIEKELKIANQNYSIRIKPRTKFNVNISTTSSWAGISTALLTLLLAAFVSFTQTAEQRANLLVDERTKQLEITGRIAKLGGWEVDLIKPKIFWSKVTREIHGFEDGEEPDLQTAINFYKDEHDRKVITEAFNLAVEKGIPWDLELQITTIQGKNIWVRTIGQAQLQDGKPIRIFGTFQDITDRIILEQQLTSERSKLLQTSKMASLGEMSAGMAHEINNPLAIIVLATAQLSKYSENSENSEKINGKIEKINKAIDRISKIVKGLKKFSRSSEQNNYKNHILAEIVNESIMLTDSKLKHTNVKLECNIISNSTIFCDEIEIEQVLVNLISNAIDAAEKGNENWIKIQVFDNSEHVILKISDSGLIIPDNIRDKIFDPFFTTKPVGKGTGLGLSITKGILEEHKAVVNMSFSPNTCFEIHFPKV